MSVTPYRPMKTTEVSKITNKNPNNHKIEQSLPTITEKGKVTAVVAIAIYSSVGHHKSSKKGAKEKLIRVLRSP